MSLNVCQQDIVGFNPQNSGGVLAFNVPTLINDAIIVNTTATPNYSGQVTLSITNQHNVSAVFQTTGSTQIVLTVLPNQIIYVPIIVTVNNCGYNDPRWGFELDYLSSPQYGAYNDGTTCSKPERDKTQCWFLFEMPSVCRAGFDTTRTEVTGTGTKTLTFNLGTSPQCTGALTVTFNSGCDGITFDTQTPVSGITWEYPSSTQVIAHIDWGCNETSFPLIATYDAANILCYCDITATTVYNSSTNPNLITQGNNGTLSGLFSRSEFLAAGVDNNDTAPYASTISYAAGEDNPTCLRVTLSSTPISATLDFNVPYGNTSAGKNVFWLMDGTNPVTLTPGYYYIRGRVKISGIHPIKANSAIWIRGYRVGGGTQTVFDTHLYMSQYSPSGSWFTIGEIFKVSGGNVTLNPYVHYEQFAFGSDTGDLLLNGDAVIDFADIELTNWYPTSGAIVCPDSTHTFHNTVCDYETVLDLTIDDCKTVDFSDSSDFGYTPGHELSDFTLFRKLTVTLPDGNQQVLSSVVPYNIYVNPAASDTNQPFYSGFPVTMGGVYSFTLCNVPTYNPSVTYLEDTDCVCLLDSTGTIRFFRSVAPRPGVRPLVNIGWQNTWEEIPESELDDKYCDTKTYVQLCGLKDCIKEYKNKLMCSLEELCNNSICANECLSNYLELVEIEMVLDDPNQYWNTKQITDALNVANKLCLCNCNCK